MGFDVSWLASRSLSLPELESRLGLRRTGDSVRVFEEGIASAQIAGGWALVMASDASYIESLDLARISAGVAIDALAAHEGAMISMAECWSNGRQLWRVMHNGQEGLEHLAVSGSPPIELATARASCDEAKRARRQPAAVTQQPIAEVPEDLRVLIERMGAKISAFDISTAVVDHHFDIPVELAELLVGFRHDTDPGAVSYFTLEPT